MASSKNASKKEQSASPHLLTSSGAQIGRQLAGGALGTSESFLHSILDQSPYPMWIADDQGTLIWLNQACRDLLYLTGDEVIGRYNVFQDNIVEQQGFMPLLRRVFEKGEAIRFELTYDTSLIKNLQVSKTTTVILDITVSPITDGSGRITNAVFQHVDITERKLAEEALKKEKLFTEAILDSLPGTFFLLDAQGKHLLTNTSGQVASGYSQEELYQLHALDFIADEDKPAAQRALAEVFETGKISLEAQHVAKDGTKTPFLFNAKKFIIDDTPYILGTGMNITERKQMEASLARTQFGVDRARDAIHWVRADGGLAYVNQAFCDSLGYSREELLSLSIFDIDPGLTKEQWPEIWRQSRELKTRIFETFHKTKEGRTFPVEIAINYINFDGEEYHCAFGRDIRDRKQAEEALRESEKEYRSLYHEFQGILNTIPDTVCLLSPDLMIVWANQVSASRQDIPNISEIGKRCYPQRHGRSEPCENCPVLRCFSTGKMETEVTAAHGRVWELRAFPIYDDQGEVRGGLEVARDISERQQMEEALRESEARFRQVVESSPLPMGISNASGEIEYLNPKFVETFGYTLEDLPQLEDWFRLAYPDPASRQLLLSKWQKSWQRIKEDGVTEVKEVEITCKDGSTRIMQLFGTLMDDKCLILFNDLTERKRAEIALRDSERRLSEIIDFLPDATLAVDLSGKVIAWNRAIEEMTGVKAESMMGKGNYEYALPFYGLRRPILMDLALVSDAEIEKKYTFIKREGEILVCEADVPLKGEIHPLWAKSRPLYNSEGKIVGAIETIRDLTERKRAEEERARLEAQMREVQKLESLGVLAGGIAHDFNNLLMAILGNADLALLALSPASPARPYVEEIARGSLRAADLCSQMLAYSGKGRFVIGRYDLSEIVQEMARMLKVSVSKKASLRYSFTADLPAVEVDATQMRQVIMNLIINASEALEDQNGFISVSTGVMDCDRAYLSESYLDDRLPEGKYVFLEVADTGCGMDDDTRRRIFDPFFTTKFTGRGLGLAAVLGIVRGHQGALKVYSEPSQGTTFKVLFPAVDWAPGGRVVNASQGGQSLPGGTILLVDDDSHVRQVVSQMLERLGFKVLTANHGREGLEIFKANNRQIDCVILDLTMPEMAGDEVFRELRRLRKDVRVILSSGFNEQDVTQRFAGKGFAGFIQKPYTVGILQEVLTKVFRPV